MLHKIIKTDNYLLVVDDSEIKPLDWCINLNTNSVFHFYTKRGLVIDDKKIIAHLPLNNSSILEGVDLLPPIEDEVEKLAYKYNPVMKLDNEFIRAGFKAGYNKAKEKYKYTEEDLKKAINLAYVSSGGGDTYPECEEFVSEQLESLQQAKIPVGFECDTEFIENKLWGQKGTGVYKPKTTINLQGLTRLVGKYIY